MLRVTDFTFIVLIVYFIVVVLVGVENCRIHNFLKKKNNEENNEHSGRNQGLYQHLPSAYSFFYFFWLGVYSNIFHIVSSQKRFYCLFLDWIFILGIYSILFLFVGFIRNGIYILYINYHTPCSKTLSSLHSNWVPVLDGSLYCTVFSNTLEILVEFWWKIALISGIYVTPDKPLSHPSLQVIGCLMWASKLRKLSGYYNMYCCEGLILDWICKGTNWRAHSMCVSAHGCSVYKH